MIRGDILLNRKVVREFLDEELKGTEIPDDIFKDALVETFCKYVEDDYYEWPKDNLRVTVFLILPVLERDIVIRNG